MVKVLVSGGAGFIGSHVVGALALAGHDVVVVDNLSTGRAQNLPAGARLKRLSLSEPGLRQLVALERPEVIFHLAAQISVRASVANPLFDAATNILGLIRLLDSAAAAGSVRRIIFSSTGGAIYGDSAPVPAPETSTLAPLSPYGCSKAASELYLGYYQAAHGIDSVALRYANVYGPRQDPHGEAGVVAIFAQGLLAGRQCRINGTGEQTRDFVYVGDVARANLCAMHAPVRGAFNIGTGIETNINQLYSRMAQHVQGALAATHGPALPGEQLRSAIDSRVAASQLGWHPEIGLDEGLSRTLDWFRAHK